MISINIDMGDLLDFDKNLRPRLDKAMEQAVQSLTMQTHAHIMEQVQQKLHSTREKYTKALGMKQVNSHTWVIDLDQSAMFIEEGMDEHEMIDDLLKSKKAKTAKDGSKYVVVPFQQNKGPSKQTPAAQDLTATVKSELKRRNIPYGKLETDEKGKPKTGLLHSFDIMGKPVKTHEGPGQGHGAIGKVRQGMTGIPMLQGVRVYQKADPHGKVNRQIMTFRVASSKHKGTGRWVHPGLDARKFFDEAAMWALTQWETMQRDIMKALAANL